MKMLEQSPALEKPLVLDTFEHASTALGVFRDVHGEEHDPDSPEYHLDNRLFDLIANGPHVVDPEFTGEQKEMLEDALEKAANGEIDSLHAMGAKALLGMFTPPACSEESGVAPASIPSSPEVVGSTDQETVILRARKPLKLARKITGLFQRHTEVKLEGLGDFHAALVSVEELSEDQRNPEKVLEAAQELRAIISRTDPFHPEVQTISGRNARVVHKALGEAASRAESVTDLQAQQLIAA